jgi:excisionase family DNA binding protein
MQPTELVRLREMARRLDTSERTLRRLVEDGVVPAYRVRGQLRFDPGEVFEVTRAAATLTGGSSR